MKIRWLCAAMLAVAASGATAPGLAEVSEISVGLYADKAGTAAHLTVAPYEPFWLYLVLERPVSSLPALVGHPMHLMAYTLRLRCQFEIPDNLWVINFDTSLDGQCGTFLQNRNPDIDASYGYDVMHWPGLTGCLIDRCLMRVGLMALDDAPAAIDLRAGADGGTGDGLPTLHYYFDSRYVDRPCAGVLGLRPLPAGPNSPVFIVNGTLVPVDAASWSAVKTLYR
jgi:hypothetical protein